MIIVPTYIMQQNTIEILTSINQSVKQIAQSMKPQNGSGAAATAKLSQGNVTTTADVNPAANVAKSNINKASITSLIGVLNSLAPSVRDIAKLSNSDIKGFTKVIDAVIESINKLSEISEKNKTGLESAKLISETIAILENGINKAPLMIVTAPLAIAGLTLANYAVGRIIKIIDAANKVKNVNDKVKKLNSIVDAIDQIQKVILKGAGLFALCIGLGLVVEKAGSKDLMLLGFATLGGIMLTTVALVGVAGLAASMLGKLDAIKAIDQIMNVVFKSTALVAVCMALGYFIMNGPTRELILGGLAALGGVIVAVTSIILLTGLASKIIGEVGAFKGIKEIMTLTLASVALVALCFGLGMAIESMGGWEPLMKGLVTVGGTLLLLGGIFFFVGLVGLVATSKPVMDGLKGIFLMTIGSMALIVGAKYLGDFVLENYDRVLLGLGSTLVVMGALLAIGWAAGKALSFARQGLIALGAMEALAAGAAWLIYLLTEVHKKRSDSGVSWDDIGWDVLSISVILGYVGALSFAASSILPEVAMGTAAVGAIELAILGSILLTERMVQFHKTKDEAGVSWGDIELDILGMTAALGTFAVLGGAIAVASIPLLIATPAMAVLAAFSLSAIGVVKSVVSLHKAIESAGGAEALEKTLSVDMPKIMSNINAKNFDSDMGILTMLRVAAKYKAMASLVSGVLDVAESISKIAKIIGMVDDQGRISPIISKNILTGEVKYGEPVDLVNVATIIGNTVQKFVEGCQYSFTDVLKMYNAAEIFHVIGMITDPIAKFVDMLTGYKESGDGMLSKITIDQQGNVKVGQAVKVADVASMIANSVSTFVSELYKKENTEKWSELIYGDRTFLESLFGQTNKRADSVREIAGVLGVIMDPVVKFMDMITSLEADGKSMSKIVIDKDGNIKSGKKVDVFAVANSVASLISSFVGIIYDEKNGISNKSAEVAKVIEEVIKPIGTMIKTAENLSTDKINADLVRGNADAMMYANVLLIKSVSDADPVKMSAVNASINELVNIGERMGSSINKDMILSNSKSIVSFMNDIVEDKFPKDSKIIDKFSGSVLDLKQSFKDLDDVLIKEEDRRKKALDDFQTRLKEILETIVNSKEALDTFNTTITNMTNYQTPTYQQPSYQTQESQGGGVPYAPGYQPENQQQGGGNVGSVDVDALARAISDAMKNLVINPTNTPEITGNITLAEAITALGKIGYTID